MFMLYTKNVKYVCKSIYQDIYLKKNINYVFEKCLTYIKSNV